MRSLCTARRVWRCTIPIGIRPTIPPGSDSTAILYTAGTGVIVIQPGGDWRLTRDMRWRRGHAFVRSICNGRYGKGRVVRVLAAPSLLALSLVLVSCTTERNPAIDSPSSATESQAYEEVVNDGGGDGDLDNTMWSKTRL